MIILRYQRDTPIFRWMAYSFFSVNIFMAFNVKSQRKREREKKNENEKLHNRRVCVCVNVERPLDNLQEFKNNRLLCSSDDQCLGVIINFLRISTSLSHSQNLFLHFTANANGRECLFTGRMRTKTCSLRRRPAMRSHFVVEGFLMVEIW